MAGDRKKTAGEAAKEKVERREKPEQFEQDSEKSSEELKRDVEAAREELADTVEELTDRLDPRPKVEHAKEQAKATAQDNAPVIAIGVGALLLLLLWWLRRD